MIKKPAPELQLVLSYSSNSRRAFRDQCIAPSIEAGLVAMTHPDNPRHPQQQYYLTELGLAVLKVLIQENAKESK